MKNLLRDKSGLTEAEFLALYKPGDYPHPSVTVDMILFSIPDASKLRDIQFIKNGLKVLLVQRGGHPCLGEWAFPGGFVEREETVGQAAQRELLEETGIQDLHLQQLYTFSNPHRDPRGWTMTCAHMTVIDGSKYNVCAGDDADQAEWFDLQFDIIHTEQPAAFQYQFSLKNGHTILSAVVECPKSAAGRFDDDLYMILKNDGIAFDHAKLLTCGVMHLLSDLT